jgi:hypothetical protein
LSIGTITMTGNLVLNGAYNVEASINNLITDSADKLNVNGTVNLTGSTLNLTTLTSIDGDVSSAVVIIQNDGIDAVTGTFATVNSNNPNFQFTIDYAYAGPGGGTATTWRSCSRMCPSRQPRYWSRWHCPHWPECGGGDSDASANITRVHPD